MASVDCMHMHKGNVFLRLSPNQRCLLPFLASPFWQWFLQAAAFSSGKLSEALFSSADRFTREHSTSYVWKHSGCKRAINRKALDFTPRCRRRQISFSGYCRSTLHRETTALLYQKHDLHLKIFGFSESMQKALKAQLYPRWSLGALATKFCYIILALQIPHSCLPAFFPRFFHLSSDAQGSTGSSLHPAPFPKCASARLWTVQAATIRAAKPES